MSHSQYRPCNETRDILCAKVVDVHMVMIHAKFQSSKPFGLKERFLACWLVVLGFNATLTAKSYHCGW